jgi:hypothetical protein
MPMRRSGLGYMPLDTDKLKAGRNGEALLYIVLAVIGCFIIGSDLIQFRVTEQSLLGGLLLVYATWMMYSRVISYRLS